MKGEGVGSHKNKIKNKIQKEKPKMKEFRWNTLCRNNVQRTEHAWNIRLVGKPEYREAIQLFNILDKAGFTYRVISSDKHTVYNKIYVCPTAHPSDIDYINILPAGIVYSEQYNRLYHIDTGEVIAYGYGQTIKVLVYKNTTRLELVYR